MAEALEAAPPEAPVPVGLSHLQNLFLEHYRVSGLRAASAEVVGVPLRSVERWRRQPTFAEAMEDAEEHYRDTVRREIHRRAVEGWEEPVYRGGLLAGYVRRYSDALLVLLSKTKLPEFREDVSGGSVNVLNQTQVVLAWKEKPLPAGAVIEVESGDDGGSEPARLGASD